MADICINWVLIIRRRIHCSEPGAIEDLAKTFELRVSGRQMRERHWLISDCGIWRVEADIWPRPQSRIILLHVHTHTILKHTKYWNWWLAPANNPSSKSSSTFVFVAGAPGGESDFEAADRETRTRSSSLHWSWGGSSSYSQVPLIIIKRHNW